MRNKGVSIVGIGFIIIVVLLAVMLGLFARQALANVDETANHDSSTQEQVSDDDHHHAI